MKRKFIGVAGTAIFSLATMAHGQTAKDYKGPIIDAHAHIRLGEHDNTAPNHPIGTDALLKLDDGSGITKSALIVIAFKGQLNKTRAKNDAVMAAAATSGGRFYPVVSVHPADKGDALTELERVAKLGAKEVKLHPNTQNFDVSDPDVGVVVDKCGELGLVILFDSYKPWDASEIGKFLLLSVQHPKTKIVLAHMGLTGFRETLAFATLKNRLGMGQNVWFDLSAIAPLFAGSPVQPELVWTIRQIGTDRFLFGSDWPAFTPEESVKAVRTLGFTEAEQKQIFHDNAVKLLGLEN
jgi:uncharacterized protein